MPRPAHAQPRFRYRCAACDLDHDGLPTFGYGLPDIALGLTTAQRAARLALTDDFCVLDGARFHVRCLLRLPVQGMADCVEYIPWIEISEDDYRRYGAYRDGFGEAGFVAMDGVIANALAGHQVPTLGLSCRVSLSADPCRRPLIRTLASGHALRADLRNGISVPRVLSLVARTPGVTLLAERAAG